MHFQCLEDLRIDNDKTQAEVAKHLGCQREVYRRYEKSLLSIFPSKKSVSPYALGWRKGFTDFYYYLFSTYWKLLLSA